MTVPTYGSSKKHHWPEGWGNLCPRGLSTTLPQDLLARSVDGVSTRHPQRRYAVYKDFLFEAQRTRGEVDLWHGYPVVGSENTDVLEALAERQMIDLEALRRLRRQKRKPDALGEAE